MKKFAIGLFAVIISITALWNCGGKGEVTEIKSLEVYKDNLVNFSIKYPSNWVTFKQPSSRFLVYSTAGLKTRYPNYDPVGVAGAKIEILISPIDSIHTLDSIIANKTFEKDYYTDPVKVTLDGVEAVKQSYDFELEDGPFHGEVYYATKDGKLATALYLEAFAGTYDAYKKDFEAIVASLKLAVKPEEKADTVQVLVEADPPSLSLRQVSGDGFTIEIPDNFSKESGFYLGKRRGDSYIKVDVTDASKTKDMSKLVEENRKKLNGASAAQNLTLGGEKAMKVMYKASSTVDGEIYFILKNKKLYRITLNWFKGEEKDFKPIFQKCAMTMKIQ